MEQRERRDFVRASGMSEYTFCARAWWLRREGVEPTRGGERRAAGKDWHERHGRGVERARTLRLVATLCTFAALALGILLLVLEWRRW
jgi:CRISPR/Cas system-associated exonuclease Cas4 (RecB family)